MWGRDAPTTAGETLALHVLLSRLVIFRKRVVGLSEASLARFVKRASRAASLRGGANVLLTSSRELQSLNRRFRGKDKATDVLSFPAARGLAGGFVGDVAISADIAAKNARRLGHAPAMEIKILALHGVLHLAGYDHERDHGEMARKEERLRRSLGLPAGLIERNGKAKSLNHGEHEGRPLKTRRGAGSDVRTRAR
jgi:probable rRNA maturation factor